MKRSLPSQHKPIVFIGFMGVGKTTIAKEVAKKLGRAFIDIDEEIESQYKMTATEIFQQYGEAAFRRMETEKILHWCDQPKRVISLGGGAFLREENRRFCMEHAIVVSLHMDWDAWKKRLPILVANRPNLQNRSIDDIQQLYLSRQSIYQHYHVQIKISGTESIVEITENVLDEIKYLI